MNEDRDPAAGLPVVDLARRATALQPGLDAAIARVLRSGRFLLDAETAAFEAELAESLGRRHAVTVSSGTEALRLAMVAAGIGAGDEVIVPAFTAVPTAAAVCGAGAVPVPVDVDPETALIDWNLVAAARTSRTRLVIPVHLYGRPAEIPEIGVPVLEDAAQALGALDPGAGSLAAAYSFYPTKNLGGIGDGGAVVTDDDALADRVRLLRRHGLTDAGGYVHRAISGNSRLSELEAAALRVALPDLAAGNERRRRIAGAYRAAAPELGWQAPHERHVYHLCVARIPDRDEFRDRMPFRTAVHYSCPITRQPAYRGFAREECPVAEEWASACVSLPCFPEMTDEEIGAVCNALP